MRLLTLERTMLNTSKVMLFLKVVDVWDMEKLGHNEWGCSQNSV